MSKLIKFIDLFAGIGGMRIGMESALNDLNINLTKLESRPILGRPWEYKFYIDYELSDSNIQHELIERIDLVSKEFKILGHYPKANQE